MLVCSMRVHAANINICARHELTPQSALSVRAVTSAVLGRDNVPTSLYFDWMSVGLGLLVNLVEHHPINREALRRPRTSVV